MWKAHRMVSSLYRGDSVIELKITGRTSSETFPYDEIGLQAWHKRSRAVYPVPDDVLQQYLPLASATFQRLCVQQHVQHGGGGSSTGSSVTVIGDIGMGFVLDDMRQPKMSVEAAALHQLVQTGPEKYVPKADWLCRLQQTWYHHMSLFMFDTRTGWRGCFAEHRLWSSLLYHTNEHRERDPNVKTPYAVPTIRGWFPKEILTDFEECVGTALARKIAATVARMGFDGAPDLVLYNSEPMVWFVEVKSATDTLKDKQVQMMQALSEIEHVKCQICCPQSALKRFASVMLSRDDDSD